VITVDPFIKDDEAEIKELLDSPSGHTPLVSQLVHARISRVEDRFCKVDILAVNEQPVASVFVGIVMQENVRDFDRGNVDMHNCFRPGDIIKARVLASVGGGTSRDSSVLLTTAEEELGVVFARSPHTGSLMVPRSWSEFECVQTKKKEKRKVAKVN
jgi:exosome complex component CSL4